MAKKSLGGRRACSSWGSWEGLSEEVALVLCLPVAPAARSQGALMATLGEHGAAGRGMGDSTRPARLARVGWKGPVPAQGLRLILSLEST